MNLKRKLVSGAALCLVTLGFGLSCGGDDVAAVTAWLTHSGFDFSAGLPCEAADSTTEVTTGDCDGDMIGWVAFGTDNSTRTDPIWFRTQVSNSENRLKDLGEISLIDVDNASIPTTWPTDSPEMLLNHAYIMQTQDGYAAFVVIGFAADTSADWEAEVEYVYSADGQFTQ